MDATSGEALPLMSGGIRRSARVATTKKEERQLELFSSVARQLYDSNLRLPPKKRIRGLSSLLKQKPESKMTKASPSPSKKTKYNRKLLDKPPIESEPAMEEALAEKIRGMGGERVQLLMQKQLEESDITAAKSRLSIPSNKAKTQFLSEAEKATLSQHVPNTKTMRGIDVLVIDPRLEELKLCLKRWVMKHTFVYNLIENWNTLVKENKLEAGDRVQLWVFRVEERRRSGLSDLCFALVKLELNNNGGPDVNDSSNSTITAHDEDRRVE